MEDGERAIFLDFVVRGGRIRDLRDVGLLPRPTIVQRQWSRYLRRAIGVIHKAGVAMASPRSLGGWSIFVLRSCRHRFSGDGILVRLRQLLHEPGRASVFFFSLGSFLLSFLDMCVWLLLDGFCVCAVFVLFCINTWCPLKKKKNGCVVISSKKLLHIF